jgi:general secretion pathway protein L
MSSLIVLLPPGEAPGLGPGGWGTALLPYALVGHTGEVLELGLKPFEALPRASTTVLIVAARDTLLLHAKLPPVTGPRLQRMLPNVVEEYLIRDAQRCHIAIDPTPGGSGERCLAVIDRDWFASVIAQFVQAGHKRLRAVPLIHCIPPAEELEQPDRTGNDTVAVEPMPIEPTLSITEQTGASALVVPRNSNLDDATPDQGQSVELALRQRALGFGMSVNAAQLDATLDELAQRQTLWVYSLDMEGGASADVDVKAEPALNDEAIPQHTGHAWVERRLSLATLAGTALACRFNLCQFDFANPGRGQLGAGGLKPWRIALGFTAATLLISVIALNVQWFQLRLQRDALNEQMTSLVKSAFPGAIMVLDPHTQMALELARLGKSAGELHSDDFLTLASGLAHGLGPIPSASIAELNYSGGALQVTFKPDTQMDEDGLKGRLAANGLRIQEDDGKWTLKPAQSGPR